MYNPKIRNGHAALVHDDLRLAPAGAKFERRESIKDSLAYALAGIACAAPVVFAIIIYSFI